MLAGPSAALHAALAIIALVTRTGEKTLAQYPRGCAARKALLVVFLRIE
jgi:hypothetical protein